MNERLTPNIYPFTPLIKVAGTEVLQALVRLAIKETELVFRRAKRKLQTDCQISRKAVCTVERGTECGDHLAKLLAGFLTGDKDSA